MATDLQCPKCGEPCDRESVDVGIGVVYGPWGCICGWSQDPEYDSSDGSAPANLANPARWTNSRGVSYHKERIAEGLGRFGLDGDEIIKEVF
jgi:hypothetical protein